MKPGKPTADDAAVVDAMCGIFDRCARIADLVASASERQPCSAATAAAAADTARFIAGKIRDMRDRVMDAGRAALKESTNG
jgi:hypothetical protein